ncbi:hypothetical protein CKF54_00895 [Psittacicella hinzii]|uniref:DUF2190 family protein n=1 Tax=Psittacicella hinzii TaxID=2028575 RepID=A0A3A1YAU6_9GAMM|nr:DUF2190 family protein [Psittacicella hinzii]RIY34330.1 hypothetical protein CKF54_00895 [Psittacicella hinzii]
MANLVRHDGALLFDATVAIENGELYQVGDVVGVASKDFEVGEKALIYTYGSFEVKAKDGDTFTQGKKVYFDKTTKSVTTEKGTGAGNPVVGYVFTPPQTQGTDRVVEVMLKFG